MSTKLIIGLTGGIGSGKSTVAQAFRQLGIEVICADQIAKELVRAGSRNLTEIKNYFGDSMLTINGQLNRSALQQRIFENPSDKKWLEALLHPQVRAKMSELIELAHSPYVIFDIPLLLESLPNPLVRRILIVDCSEAQQQQRTKLRDNLPDELIQKIMQQQISRKDRLLRADDIIDNTGSIEETKRQILRFDRLYRELAGKI